MDLIDQESRQFREWWQIYRDPETSPDQRYSAMCHVEAHVDRVIALRSCN